MVSFVLSFSPRDVLGEILNLIESDSKGFLPTLVHFLSYVLIMKISSFSRSVSFNGFCS